MKSLSALHMVLLWAVPSFDVAAATRTNVLVMVPQPCEGVHASSTTTGHVHETQEVA